VGGACILAESGAAGISFIFGDHACLAVDGANVYFAAQDINGGSSGILYVPESGGSTTNLTPMSSGLSASGVAVDTSNVYWADYTGGKIFQTSKPEAGTITTKPIVASLTSPVRVAVDATNVYWTSTGSAGVAPKGGGSPEWMSIGESLWGLTVDASYVYFGDLGSGNISRAYIATGATTSVATGQIGVRGLTSDPTHLAWVSTGAGASASGAVQYMVKGGSPATPLVMGLTNPYEVALDTTQSPNMLYWSENASPGAIWKVSVLSNSSPTMVATNQKNPTCLAVDGESVYWMATGSVAVMKAAK
jgi:hypothetical protein